MNTAHDEHNVEIPTPTAIPARGLWWAGVLLLWMGCSGAPPVPQPKTSAATDKKATSGPACDRSVWPPGWETMEIEAKWLLPRQQAQSAEGIAETFHKIFPDGGQKYGFDLEIVLGGISRKVVDIYYDTPAATLGTASEVLRHRTSYTAADQKPFARIEALEAATWERSWERVDHKGPPTRLGAMWFRHEKGACRLWDRYGNRPCPQPVESAAAVLGGKHPEHEAIASLRQRHPDLPLDKLRPVAENVDYRYRVLFSKNEEPLLELSLDRIRYRALPSGEPVNEIEVELELVTSDRTAADVEMLFDVARKLRAEQGWIPSTGDKGGSIVRDVCRER